jgi:ABC-type phosphate transport system permease subunit
VSRGAGEVAPIIFTGAANFLPYLPTDLRDMFMHLGYHVFALSTQSPQRRRRQAHPLRHRARAARRSRSP